MRTILVVIFMLVMSLTTVAASEIHVRERIAPTLEFDFVLDFNYGRAIVMQQTDYDWQLGIIDTYGNFVFPLRYLNRSWGNFLYFSEGLIGMECEETYLVGFYDIYGNLVIPHQFLDAMHFSQGLAAVRFDGWREDEWGFIDTAGQVVIPPAFDNVRSFSGGRAAVMQGEWQTGWGFIDTTGRMVVYPSYSQVTDFANGFATVAHLHHDTGEQPVFAIIDHYGNHVSWFELCFYIGSTIPPTISDGLVAIAMSQYDGEVRYGFADIAGNVVVLPMYNRIVDFSEGRATVGIYVGADMGIRVGQGQMLFGVVDTTGNMVVPHRYYWIGTFSEGRASVQSTGENGRAVFGFIDRYGNEIIPLRYPNSGWFSEGLAVVSQGERENARWGVIDRYGNQVVPFGFESISTFSEGLAWVRQNGLWGLIEIFEPADEHDVFNWEEYFARSRTWLWFVMAVVVAAASCSAVVIVRNRRRRG